jgi:hypothetical protein
MENPTNILNSWKEIAVYLGRGVRTVQRWEQDLELPVRRPANRSRSAVIALRTELDDWIASRPARQGNNGKHAQNENSAAFLLQRLSELREEVRLIAEQLEKLKSEEPRLANKKAANAAFLAPMPLPQSFGGTA